MPKLVARIQGDAVQYGLREGEKELARATVLPDDSDGVTSIQKLESHVAHRGQGHARALLQHIKKSHGEDVIRIRPRPFGDMPMSQEALQHFYESEGFRVVDQRGTMQLSPKKIKVAEPGWQPDDHERAHWQYPGISQQAHMASPGSIGRLPRVAAKSPKHLLAALVASELLGNPKTAAVVVRAFEDELRKLSAAGSR